MKRREMGVFVGLLLAVASVCAGASAQKIEGVQEHQGQYEVLAGAYELHIEGRTLPFRVRWDAEEGQLFFEATSGGPSGPTVSEPMVPTDETGLAFESRDPAGQVVELAFEIGDDGRVARSTVRVPGRGWTGEAVPVASSAEVAEAVSGPPEDAPRQSPMARLSNTLNEAVREGRIVGGEILVMEHGSVVLHEVAGWSDLEREIPLQRNSIYRMRSMTKPFIGTAILMLEEEGRLNLEDPVWRFLPSFDNDAARDITVRHLLTHRSGYQQIELPGEYWARGNLRDAVDLIGERGPAGTPGAEFVYSDQNSATLGAIVFEITGEPVEIFLQERILAPLALESTFTRFRPDADWAPRMNSTYVTGAEGITKYWDNTQAQTTPFFRASGGLYSAVFDYARFLQAWMNLGRFDGGTLLRPETVRRALTRHDGLSRPDRGYGMHWEVYGESDDPDVLPPFGHGGSDGTIAIAIPAKDMMVLFFTQTRGAPIIGSEILPLVRELFF